jgi:AcrR family transcriptional regulator
MSASRDADATPGPKERTRRLLAEAARELLRTGQPLTVQAAAKLAGVSRATAYRYFPSNEAVVLHATSPFTDDPSGQASPMPPASLSGEDLPSQAAALVREMGTWAFEHETELRTLLRLSLSTDRADRTPRRGATSRDRWIANLLDGLPERVTASERRRLAAALIPLFGADAIVWTTDIADLDRQEALDVLTWMAAALVQATLDRGRPLITEQHYRRQKESQHPSRDG